MSPALAERGAFPIGSCNSPGICQHPAMNEPDSYRQTSRKFARSARTRMTKGEEYVWQLVRRDGLGAPFRRQMPIGPYIVDFACPSARLTVEVDGRTHHNEEARERDRFRQLWLERQGWRVLRFDDETVIGGSQVVANNIRAAIQAAPTGKKQVE